MTFRRHAPSFIDADPTAPGEFATLDELLQIPYVAGWATASSIGTFHRFSLSRSSLDTLLMAEYDQGSIWWVIGYIDGGEGLDLPEWSRPGVGVEVVQN